MPATSLERCRTTGSSGLLGGRGDGENSTFSGCGLFQPARLGVPALTSPLRLEAREQPGGSWPSVCTDGIERAPGGGGGPRGEHEAWPATHQRRPAATPSEARVRACEP